MSVVGLPIEKSSASMSVFNYDFKVPYYPESDECKVPYKATSEAAGYGLYAAEDEEILPKTNAIVSLDLRIAIPKGFFGKIFSRSGNSKWFNLEFYFLNLKEMKMVSVQQVVFNFFLAKNGIYTKQ